MSDLRPVDERVLRLVLEFVRTEAGALAWGHDLQDVLKAPAYPALYLTLSDVEGPPAELQGAGQIEEPIPFYLVGYVKADLTQPSGEPDQLFAARADFARRVRNALYHPTLEAQLETDLKEHDGQGCSSVRHVAAPETDASTTPPYGWFRLSCLAQLHYTLGAF